VHQSVVPTKVDHTGLVVVHHSAAQLVVFGSVAMHHSVVPTKVDHTGLVVVHHSAVQLVVFGLVAVHHSVDPSKVDHTDLVVGYHSPVQTEERCNGFLVDYHNAAMVGSVQLTVACRGELMVHRDE
jgi:hypothetical protein